MRKIKIESNALRAKNRAYILCPYQYNVIKDDMRNCNTGCAWFHAEERIGITGKNEIQVYCKDHCIGELT